MDLNLSGKIALVTGGSRGIGRECCRFLSKANAEVIINYEKSKRAEAEEIWREISNNGQAMNIFQADISDPDEVKSLFQYITKKFGRLDILVNNAGIVKENLMLTTELSNWNKVHDVNLNGAFLCTKSAVELMLSHKSGKIINIASVVAIRGISRLSTYASSKGGLISFTKSCAVELARKNININVILPGFIETGMTKRFLKRSGEKILERIPCNRFGYPEDVANLVVFLASDKADYITGQSICVDGGFTIS